jgi:class 3 adenylate cyclase
MGKDIELAILFADVVGSTRIYEVMGDLRARDMILTCVEIMRAATEQNHGTVIKTIGDEIMATFPTANDAINAGSRMQHDIRIHAELKVEGQPIAIRIGGHFGPVVLENRDIFGAAVHTANRMTSQAKAGQIMITSAMVERLAPEWQSAVRQIDVATLKGKTSEDELYEVLWQKEDATSMLPAIALGAAISSREKNKASRRLRLRFQGQEIVVDESRANIAIGRAEENDIVVKGNLISRLHAKIELVRNKFQLIDQSTNGTFVTTREGEEAFVRRDSMLLKGEGMIGFGRLPETNSSLTIRFVCEE